MDMTELTRTLLEPIPAHQTAAIEVVRAADGVAELSSETPAALTNVIGSMHSSGLITMVDAAALAAIIAASPPGAMAGIVPLGRAASLQFLAPARGRLRATCALTEEARNALRPLWSGNTERVRLSTQAHITDADGVAVCRGQFDWSLRRMPQSAVASAP